MTRVVKLSCLPVFLAALVSIGGCSQSTEAKKLTAPEGVDWAAIEAQGEEMNELQSEGE